MGRVVNQIQSADRLGPDTTTPRGGARERLLHIHFALVAEYGAPVWQSAGPPLDVLIETILSQHTSDVNTARAYASLRSRFPSWADLLTAPMVEIANAIRCGGLADVKAPRIQRVLAAIEDRAGSLWLGPVDSLSLQQARSWLLALPGVGPKTAACILLFSLGLPAMPVDTHVHRLSRRLGVVDPRCSAERAHEILDALIGADRDLTYVLHLNLIRHGRDVCKARVPLCGRCALADLCPRVGVHSGPP